MIKASNSNVKLFLTLTLCAFFASIIVCGSSKDEEGKMKNEGRTPTSDSGLKTPDSGLKALSPLEDNKPHLLNEFLSAISFPVISIKQVDMNNDNLGDILLSTTDAQIITLVQQPISGYSKESSIYYLSTKKSIIGVSKTDVNAEDSAPEFPAPVIIATEVLDVNKDGYNDIVTAYAGTLNSPLQIQLGSATGMLTDVSSALLPNLDAAVPVRLKIADINNDSYSDMVLVCAGRLNYEQDKIIPELSPRNYVLLNSGTGTFADGTFSILDNAFAYTRAMDVQIEDFNSDGFNDAFLINPSGNLLYTWNSEFAVMESAEAFGAGGQSADSTAITGVKPSIANNQQIQLDANGDGIADTITIQDGVPSIIYDSATLQKPSNSLTPEPLNPLTHQPLNSVTSYISPYQYKITAPSGLAIATVTQIGGIAYLELSSRVPTALWGNILINFDHAKLECVSIEENPNNFYGFWVWWAVATGMPYYGGGGTYYYYDDTGLGSGWAKAWAHTEPGAGPTGTYDNTTGKIRLYTDTSSGYSYTSPLKIGFRVLQYGPAEFSVQSNDFTAYDWNNVDAGTTSTVNISQSGQTVFKEDVTNNVRISISGPITVEPGQEYIIDTYGQIIMPFRAIGYNVYSWELYRNGVLYQRIGFNWGEEHRRSWSFTETQEGPIVYKFRFRDGSRVHGGYGWVEVEMTVNVAPPGPHIDSITPTSALPTEEITITGRNFDAYSAFNNIVNFKGSDVSVYASSVSHDGTMLFVHVPSSKEPGPCTVSVTTGQGTSNEVVFTIQSMGDAISQIKTQLEQKIASETKQNIKKKMQNALNVINEIEILNSQPVPDTLAILDKIKKAMNFIIEAISAGADIWDKPYILVAMRSMIAKSAIAVEESWMIIDAMRNAGAGNPAWPYLKQALMGMQMVVEKYVSDGSGKAIESMLIVMDSLQQASAVAGGVDTTAIQKSLAESPLYYLGGLKQVWADEYGNDNHLVLTVGSTISSAQVYIDSAQYKKALEEVGLLWPQIASHPSKKGGRCSCAISFKEKGGEPIKAEIKYDLYNSNCLGRIIKFAARDGDNEVTDMDDLEVSCEGVVYTAKYEVLRECSNIERFVITDNIKVLTGGWQALFANGPGRGYLTNSKNTIVDYVLPVFGSGATSNTDEIKIEIADERGNATDKYAATTTITVRKKGDVDFDLSDSWKEYAGDDGVYRIWISIISMTGTQDFVQEEDGCGCKFSISWEKKNNIAGKEDAWPYFFPVNIPQTLRFGSYTDKDELKISHDPGADNCTFFLLPLGPFIYTDYVRCTWTVDKPGEFNYGASSSEIVFTALQPSEKEDDLEFKVYVGNTNIQKQEEFKDPVIVKKTAVLTDLIVNSIGETDEVSRGAYMIANDNDSDGNGIPDANEIDVENEDPDIIPMEIKIQPLIENSKVWLEKTGGGNVRLWESPNKERQVPAEIIGQELTVKDKKIIGETQDGGIYVLPQILYLEGISASTAIRDSGFKLTYKIRGYDLPPEYTFCDSAKVTVYKMQITEILGLRKATVGDYSQEENPDNTGRLFIDTTDDGEILATQDIQRVKITVEVQPAELGYEYSQYKIHWDLYDIDDPADHWEVDPNDGGTENNPHGTLAISGDNTGSAHENAGHWFMRAEHAIRGQYSGSSGAGNFLPGYADTELSKIDNKQISTVFLYYTDDGGDNFVVRAALLNSDMEICMDKTNTLTVWRKRFIDVYAMTKQNDDIQVWPVGDKIPEGQSTVCISAGDNGDTDTLELAGDDFRADNDIDAGPDRIVQTTANSGGNCFDPKATKELFQESYGKQEPNHQPYIDFDVTNVQFDCQYRPYLERYGIATYMHTTINIIDQNNHYSILGFTEFDFLQGPDDDKYGAGTDPPHGGIAVITTVEKIIRGMDSANIHETGHMLIGEFEKTKEFGGIGPFHIKHSLWQECAYKQGVYAKIMCTRHVNLLRDCVSREFNPGHDYEHIENDSERSRW